MKYKFFLTLLFVMVSFSANAIERDNRIKLASEIRETIADFELSVVSSSLHDFENEYERKVNIFVGKDEADARKNRKQHKIDAIKEKLDLHVKIHLKKLNNLKTEFDSLYNTDADKQFSRLIDENIEQCEEVLSIIEFLLIWDLEYDLNKALEEVKEQGYSEVTIDTLRDFFEVIFLKNVMSLNSKNSELREHLRKYFILKQDFFVK